MYAQFPDLCESICEIGRRLYRFGHVVANDGNISARAGENLILTTPTGVCKGDISPEMLVFVDAAGRVVAGGAPSSELPMHLFIYAHRTDIQAVVHAHPVHATAFATAGIALDRCVLAEIVATIGSVPVAPYGTPSTGELPESLRPFLQNHEAILLANHGAVTMGRDLWEAYFKLERVEHYAKVIFISRLLGGEKPLSREQVEKLFDLRGAYGIEARNPGCKVPAAPAPDAAAEPDVEALPEARLEEIARTVFEEIRRTL